MDIERAKVLKAIMDDPNTPPDVHAEAWRQLIDMIPRDVAHRFFQSHVPEFLEIFRRVEQDDTIDPGTRREAKERAEYLVFRQRMLGGDDASGRQD
jgi:uncharacterized protein (UPF0147 family)